MHHLLVNQREKLVKSLNDDRKNRMKSRTCGNCKHFIRIKNWGSGRNGMCDKLDYNVHADGHFAKGCEKYQSKKYQRLTQPY
jgi:hypothetical protein